MPRGGKRKGAGRKPGAKDRAAAAEVASLSVLARKHAPLAVRTLATVAAKGLSEAAQVSAATALLDRGFGRPMQSMEHTGAGGGPIDIRSLTVDQLNQLEARLLGRVIAPPSAADRSTADVGEG